MKKLKIHLLLLLVTFNIYNSVCQNTMNTDWANLNKYASENQSLTPTAKSVVFMGDSITEFWKINDAAFFAENPFIDRGISGQTTPQMLLRFRQDVINLKPETVVILAGINDIAENTGPITLEQIMGNIISMVELAKANKIKVVLCSVLPANNFYWNPKLKPADKVIELNLLLKKYAKANKMSYVDYYNAMVNNEKGLLKKYGEDGVHPNLEGYKVMETILLKSL
ncbi:MAG: SGNH/GDSL hydrolase family protein [Flavobacterium sp.]|uniref:SGNH/GDSL hydrolase family protein n=1 Tax=Flavobacterium sp. TaxID=239 RepID=UPI0022BFED50|nr:SGNH/GDSL hydrolase family protein [Flavobacterium sp.]MCZ8197558.1 SGNH/GDSL hydrolase family protein [Flavobacterium sp.]